MVELNHYNMILCSFLISFRYLFAQNVIFANVGLLWNMRVYLIYIVGHLNRLNLQGTAGLTTARCMINKECGRTIFM